MSKSKWHFFFQNSLYVFLLPLFFLLHGLNENFGLIPIEVLLHLFFTYFLVSIGVVLVSWLLFRNISRAALFSFGALCVFFFFGAFHDSLKRITEGFLVSYTFLLPLIACVLLFLFFAIKRSKNITGKATRFFTILMVVISLLEFLFLAYNIFSEKERVNNLSGDPINLPDPLVCSDIKRPDIFFIVLDGYTSSKELQESFSYDNHLIDSMLESHGFFVSKNSMSNYNMTPFSLASTLNANYLAKEVNNVLISNRIFSRAVQTFKNNDLVKFLETQQYEVLNFGCFNLNGTPTSAKPYFPTWEYDLIDNQTLLSRARRDVGWVLNMKDIFTGEYRFSDAYKKARNIHINRNVTNWQYLIHELKKTKAERPRFVYAHLMLPHEPFYLDATGKLIADSILLKNKLSPKNGYINQVNYVNTLLRQLIPLSAKHSERKKIIIIQGDHGYRHYDKSVPKHKVFLNLNSYYFSDKDYSMLYDSISPVNSFRVVLNKYFCQSLPMLKDTSIYLTEGGK